MANGNPSPEELTRQNPEFGLGERLAKLEAESSRLGEDRQGVQDQMDRRIQTLTELFEEKLDGLSGKVDAKAEAQKEAVDKAEKAATQRFETFVEQNDRKSEVSQNRLAALERGESLGQGQHSGFNSAWGTVVIVVTIFIAAGTLLAVILSGSGH